MNLFPLDDDLPDHDEATTQRSQRRSRDDISDLPELLTIREVASALKLSPRSIWRLVKQRKLPPPIRIGGSIRWKTIDVSQWIAGGCPGIDNSDAGKLPSETPATHGGEHESEGHCHET